MVQLPISDRGKWYVAIDYGKSKIVVQQFKLMNVKWAMLAIYLSKHDAILAHTDGSKTANLFFYVLKSNAQSPRKECNMIALIKLVMENE